MKLRIVAWSLFTLLYGSLLHAAPFLEGTVTDEQGRPIAGASVRISDCIGTCFGGKTVLTDEEGHYIFETKPFRNSPLLAVSMPGRYEVSREQSGPRLYEPESNTPRIAHFVLGTPAAATVRLEGDVPEGVKQTVIMRPGRGTKLRRYDLSAIQVSGWSHWNFKLLPRREAHHLVVRREAITEESDDPKETEERRRQNWRNRQEIISPAIHLVDPQRYVIRARIAEDSESETPYITLESVTDAVGIDRTEELTVPNAMFGPPVDAELRERALALLERVKESATPWNALPTKEIASYEYDAVDPDSKATHVRIDQDSPSGPAWGDIARLRGFAYMPPLRWLFSQSENVVFHGVEINEDRAVLHYRLKATRGFGAGLGVGTSWSGFFTAPFSVGTIVIDPKTAVVLEHRLSRKLLDEETIESFGDYVAVGEGYAPQSLRIQSGNRDFRLKFRIHRDRLWLLHEAFHGDQPNPSFRIEDVVVTVAE